MVILISREPRATGDPCDGARARDTGPAGLLFRAWLTVILVHAPVKTDSDVQERRRGRSAQSVAEDPLVAALATCEATPQM